MNTGPERTVELSREIRDALKGRIAAKQVGQGQAASAALMMAYDLAKELMNGKGVFLWVSETVRRWRKTGLSL